MRVAVRADASQAIGWGHLKRCLALAQALRARGAQCSFHVRATDLDAVALVRQAGFQAHALGDAAPVHTEAVRAEAALVHAAWLAASPEDDAAAFVASAAATGRPDLVLVDHYALDACWHDAVRAAWSVPLAAIDDLADRAMAVDLVIDHNPMDDPGAKYRAVLRRPARLCCGGAYALLDPAYTAHERLPWRDEVASVGIFMGGTDAGGFSAWALQACREQALWQGPVEIATTSSNPHLAALRALAARDGRLGLQVDAPNLADFHARHDVQIGAGGGALWERCVLGVPTIALVCAANQRLSVPLLARDGVVVGLDVVERGPAQQQALGAALRRLLASAQQRRSLRELSLQRVDGRGAERAAAALWALISVA